MPLIQTADLDHTPLAAWPAHQVYCGLDCCLTLEVFEEVLPIAEADPFAPQIYSFERALQGPYLEMMLRGMAVDEPARRRASADLQTRINELTVMLNEFAWAVWNKPINPNSPAQLKAFFYSDEGLGLPEVLISKKGERTVSTSREALEKLDTYLFARPFVNLILLIRDLRKQQEVFNAEIEANGRFYSSYNIAGTETGRPSSSKSAFGSGRNAQNIAGSLRYPFQADPGFRLCVIDLEQVEARDVGFICGCLFGDWTFLDNCESGDLHTNNCKLIWANMPWTGDPKADRALAEGPFYREFSFRDMSKRGGHLTNYMGTSWTAARSLKVPLNIMDEFQARYCRGGRVNGQLIEPAFPAIPRWWQWTAEQLQTKHYIVDLFGRRRHFFGRPDDDTTLREAIAYLPQGSTAARMNLGLWRVWRYVREVQLLQQTFDSITFQFPETADEDGLIGAVLEQLAIPLYAPNGRKFVVPGEAKVGWNWGSMVSEADQERARVKGLRVPKLNPGGLVKWKKGQKEVRKRGGVLQRIVGH